MSITLDAVRYRAEACLEGLEGWGSEANRKHWAKSGIVAFDDKDSANRFHSAAVAKHHRSCITTWQLGLLYIICLIPRYAEALERSKPVVDSDEELEVLDAEMQRENALDAAVACRYSGDELSFPKLEGE